MTEPASDGRVEGMLSEQGERGLRAEPGDSLFGVRQAAPERRSPVPWIVAGLVVAALLAFLAIAGRHRGPGSASQLLPVDARAGALAISSVAMSESTSLSGGKSTFVDGQIRNGGTKAVLGVVVQVSFANDEGMPAQVETVPLMLIRTHEPYVDTEPVRADPLKPGEQREFRLTFEALPGNWNTQLPAIRLTHVDLQ